MTTPTHRRTSTARTMSRRGRVRAAGLATVGALVVGCSGGADPGAAARPTTPASWAPSSSTGTTRTEPVEADSRYRDGEYSAKGWYGGQPSSIDVTLTLQDDVVTAVVVTPNATNATSLDLQERFAAAVPDVVVGRNLAELDVDKLAGSSGTPVGFNDALRQIRLQAAAER